MVAANSTKSVGKGVAECSVYSRHHYNSVTVAAVYPAIIVILRCQAAYQSQNPHPSFVRYYSYFGEQIVSARAYKAVGHDLGDSCVGVTKYSSTST